MVIKVRNVIHLSNYSNYKVVDYNGREIKINKNNWCEIHNLRVEHLEAKDNIIIIYTYKNVDAII